MLTQFHNELINGTIMRHMALYKLINVVLANGMPPFHKQTITITNVELLSIRPGAMHSKAILTGIHEFAAKQFWPEYTNLLQDTAYAHVICKISANLFRPQCWIIQDIFITSTAASGHH